MTPLARTIRAAWPAGAILLIYLGLGVWFSLIIPPFETPDEHYHYAFARHLAQGNPLPVQAAEATGPWHQEGSQAPLYYWLVGRMTAAIDQSDFEEIAVLNPRANMGDPLFPGNKNRMLYSAVDWPLTGATLALRVGRWFSVALGLVTLAWLYATARLAFPGGRGPALLALATAAWLPQFVFLSASFTNDTLVIALASLTVWQLARLVTRDCEPGSEPGAPPRPIPWWEWAIVGTLLGLAALSKLQGLGLWLLAALGGGILAYRRRDWRVLWAAALPVALPALAIAGWWYWRNIALYGDWTGLSHLAAITGERASPLTWSGWWREFRGLRYSSWGLFGWFNLLLPLWVYTLLDWVTLAAIAGGLWRAWARLRRRLPLVDLHAPTGRVWAILWLWALISAGALLYWISRAEGSQGRLIFPALNALALLLTAGLLGWRELGVGRVPDLRLGANLRSRISTATLLHGLLPIGLLLCTLYTGAWLLPRAYAAPAPVAQIPAHAAPVDFFHGPERSLHIQAIHVAPGTYRPGDSVDVTLYMSLNRSLATHNAPTLQPTLRPTPGQESQDYQLFIQFLDETGAEVGNLTTHPGWGRNPTSLWQAGAIYADTYPVRVSRPIDERSPLLARIYVGFVNPATEDTGRFPVVAYDRAGNVVDPAIAGHVVLHPARPLDAEDLGLETVGVRFGDWIELQAVKVALETTDVAVNAENRAENGVGELRIQLLWHAVGAPPADLTAFVHVLDAQGVWLTGYDAVPSPRFPTSWWRAGDQILTEWRIAVPSDETTRQVWVGLYPTEEMGATRTPITQDGGQTTLHDMVLIAEIE